MNVGMWWVRLAGLLLLPAVWAGEVVPGRYIVSLTHPPDAAGRGSRAADQQARVRALMNRQGIRVNASVTTVANALIVEMEPVHTSAVLSIPGVKGIEPVEMLHVYLDRAASLSQVPQAYEAIGGPSNAGAGVKIAILDTGIDVSHPAFSGESMQAPDGYPQISPESNRSLTNGKVIVVRGYEPGNPSGLDRYGHGTAVAMAAAGAWVWGPRGPIMGVAPKAWIGVYRVSIGSSGSIPSDYVLRALDDAVSDGMDVINMSFGQVGFAQPSTNIFNEAIAAARARGVVVVCAAGNSGPDPMTVDWTASLTGVLAVGASDSDRVLFNPSILLPSGGSVTAMPGSNTYSLLPVQGQLISLTSLDPAGTACTALPEGSLTEQVALIGSGGCSFETKLDHAQAAGALAAVIVNAPEQSALDYWDAGASTLPAWAVSYRDGATLQAIAGSEEAMITLRAWQAPLNPNVVASFSSRGPTVDFNLKPDLLAVGARFLTAGQTNNPSGPLYSPTGFLVTAGTSFAAPVVSGAAALLKAARPGLTESDYRSLLVNAASEFSAGAQHAGAGRLNMAASLNSTMTVSPVSLSFGASAGTAEVARTLAIKNLGANTEAFTVTVKTRDAVAPVVSNPSFSLEPGGTAQLTFSIPETALEAGAYQGSIQVESTGSAVPARVAYWYGVRGQTPVRVSVPAPPSSGRPGDVVVVRFRVQDAAGLPMEQPEPVGVVEQGDGNIDSILQDPLSPGTWAATVRLGPLPADNVYRLTAGDASTTVWIRGQR